VEFSFRVAAVRARAGGRRIMHCRWKCVWNSKQRLREYLIAELAFRTAAVHEQQEAGGLCIVGENVCGDSKHRG